MKNNIKNTARLSFYGGTETVTGANFMLEDEKSSTRILIDCGFFQGRKIGEDENRKPFPYDPKTIDILFVTHAHIDHIGRIPRLVKEGFRGVIYSTAPTKEIAELMFTDSLGILSKEARRDNKPLIYEEKDIALSMRIWQTASYHETINIAGGFQASFKNAGHILGSIMVDIARNGRKITFTGDLGNSPAPLLRDTEKVTDSHYIVIESVYGDRDHESRSDRKQMLEDIIEETVHKGGALVIPAFSLERTQELLFELNDLVEHGRIAACPVFLDSPLAIKVTDIYKKYSKNFNQNTNDIISSGDDIFAFPNLKRTLTTEESKSIKEVPNPKVIIAGSGMSNGGRIVHHEKRYLPDPKSTLLLIGYQAVGTMGRAIADGAKAVTIFGEDVPVNARIARIHGYSAHKDMTGLLDFIGDSADVVESVFITMGEPKSSMFLAQRMKDYIGINAVVPKKGQTVELNL